MVEPIKVYHFSEVPTETAGEAAAWDAREQERITALKADAAARMAGPPLAPLVPPSRFTAYSLAELARLPTVAVDWVVRGVVPHGGVTLIVAKPGAGKSLLAYDMAACVAVGVQWLDHLPVTQGAVAYVDLDGRQSLAALRAKAAVRGLGLTDAAFDVLPIHVIADVGSLDITKQEDRTDLLQSLVAIADLRLVIFDTYADLHRGEENSPDDMVDTMQAVLTVARQLRCGVLIIHHLRKSSGSNELDDVRGSSAITGKVDAVFLLKQERDSTSSAPRLTLLQRKSRLTAEAEPRHLTLDTEEDAEGNLRRYRFVQGNGPESKAENTAENTVQRGRPTERGVPEALPLLASYRAERPGMTETQLTQQLLVRGFAYSTARRAVKQFIEQPAESDP